MFKVGDRIRHLELGMATVVCVNDGRNILLRLDVSRGNPYKAYEHQYKIAGPEHGNWYWNPSICMCSLASRKSSFKGNIK